MGVKAISLTSDFIDNDYILKVGFLDHVVVPFFKF